MQKLLLVIDKWNSGQSPLTEIILWSLKHVYLETSLRNTFIPHEILEAKFDKSAENVEAHMFL